MKFVNPIGRTPGSGVQPRACMCTDGYAGYRGMMMVVFIVAVAVVAKESIVQVTE